MGSAVASGSALTSDSVGSSVASGEGSAVGSAEGVVLASGVAVGSAVISGLGSASGSVSCAAFSAFVSTVTDTGVSASSARALIGTALKISSAASRHASDFLSFFFIFLLPFKDFSI